VAFGVRQHRHAQAVLLAQHRVGVDVDLVEANAATGQRGRQFLAQVTAAPPVQAQRANPFQ
jgi:hypothetical protein